MLKMAPASAIPVIVPSSLSEEGNPLQVVKEARIDAILGSAVISLREWLHGVALSEHYGLTQHRRHLAVEMCHLLSKMSKIVVQCSAELEDKVLQELFIKCAFHFHRLRATWDSICQVLTDTHLENLEPLTSTLIFELALEELAKKDVLAFAYALDLFAPPGHSTSIESVASFFDGLLTEFAVAPILSEWKTASLDNVVSFASVDTTKRYGYPHAGSYGSACARHVGGVLLRDLESSLTNLTTLGDQFHLFYRGIQIFFIERHAAFPHVVLNWLEI